MKIVIQLSSRVFWYLLEFACNLHTYLPRYYRGSSAVHREARVRGHLNITEPVHQEARDYVIVLPRTPLCLPSRCSPIPASRWPFPTPCLASLALFSYCDGDLCRRRRPLALAARSRYAFVSPAFTGRFQNLRGNHIIVLGALTLFHRFA